MVKNSPELIDFGKKVSAFLVSRVESLSDQEIKELGDIETQLKNQLFFFLTLTGKYKTRRDLEAATETTSLLLLKKFLESPYLDKRISALHEVKKMCERGDKGICKWISEEKIVEYIFTDSNPELISRVSPLINLMALNSLLTEEHVLLLWDTVTNPHKHGAVVEETLNVIQEVTKKLQTSHIDLFLKKIKELEKADEKMLNFLKNFYMSVYENMKGTLSRTKKKGQSFGAKCDINVFWRTIQDESGATKKEKDAALAALVHLINEIPYLDKEKITFFK